MAGGKNIQGYLIVSHILLSFSSLYQSNIEQGLVTRYISYHGDHKYEQMRNKKTFHITCGSC